MLRAAELNGWGSLTRYTDRSNRSGATLIGFTIPYATLASDFVSSGNPCRGRC
jgi:hypothetical protein